MKYFTGPLDCNPYTYNPTGLQPHTYKWNILPNIFMPRLVDSDTGWIIRLTFAVQNVLKMEAFFRISSDKLFCRSGDFRLTFFFISLVMYSWTKWRWIFSMIACSGRSKQVILWDQSQPRTKKNHTPITRVIKMLCPKTFLTHANGFS